MNLTTAISSILLVSLATSCKTRRNQSETLFQNPSDITGILEPEYENFKQYIKKERSLIEYLDLDPSSQARFFRNRSGDQTDRRKFIENNFGPSDYMPNQNTIMFDGTGFTEEDLIGFVKKYAKSKLWIKPTETNVLFGYESPFKILREDFINLNDELGKKSEQKKLKDSAPGFSNFSVDGLSRESEIGTDIFALKQKEVRGRKTELSFFLNSEITRIVFAVFAHPDKTAFKITVEVQDKAIAIANEYHLFVRFLRDLKIEKLTEILENLKTPHLAEEQKTWAYMLENHPTQSIRKLNLHEFLNFNPPQNYTFIIPDMHDRMFPQKLVELQLTDNPKKLDWLAIEAPLDCQSELYVKNVESTSCLESVFQAIPYTRLWSTPSAQKAFLPSGDYPLKVLVQNALKNSIKVYFVDAAIKYKRGWGKPYRDLLAFKTRNWIMADRMPKQGRGLLFAGVLHLNDVKDNVQDFLSLKMNPDNIGILSTE